MLVNNQGFFTCQKYSMQSPYLLVIPRWKNHYRTSGPFSWKVFWNCHCCHKGGDDKKYSIHSYVFYLFKFFSHWLLLKLPPSLILYKHLSVIPFVFYTLWNSRFEGEHPPMCRFINIIECNTRTQSMYIFTSKIHTCVVVSYGLHAFVFIDHYTSWPKIIVDTLA